MAKAAALQDYEFEYERPWLYPAQREAIFDCKDPGGNPARYAFIEASTKAGKTVGCIAWLFEQAWLGRPGQNFWWVAPVYTQARIAFRRLKKYLPLGLFKANEAELFIELINGAVIWFKSAEKPDNLYGEDVYAAVLDEASRMREESWQAVRSTLTATRGPVRCIGNVKGRKNWFYILSRRAEVGEVGMSHSKLTAYDAVSGGVLDKSEIDDAKSVLPENVFRELYLAEPSDDEGNPFGFDHIKACLAPMSDLGPAAIGIDLAKSVDYTVILGLDRHGVTCGFERFRKPWDETEAAITATIGGVPTMIDSTGVGDPIFERLARKMHDVEGFVFGAKSKQRLMEGLALAIQNREVKFPDGPIRAELEVFEYEMTRTGVKYSAPTGYHDDCVMALALAVQKRRQVIGTGDASPVEINRISPVLGG